MIDTVTLPMRQADFIALFNTFWYRDFPVALGSIEFAKRADWTTHIATSVRQVAGMMGIFSCFESGGVLMQSCSSLTGRFGRNWNGNGMSLGRTA